MGRGIQADTRHITSLFAHYALAYATLLQKSKLRGSTFAQSIVLLCVLMKIDTLSRKADYIGITGSVLCIIHCLITPILLLTSSVFQNSTIRVGYLSLDYVFIGVNIVAVYFATRHYAAPVIKKSLWGFLALFTIALLLEDEAPFFEYLAYTASAGLVITHLINIKQHKLNHTH